MNELKNIAGLDNLTGNANYFVGMATNILPSILKVLLFLIVGMFIAKALRSIVKRLLNMVPVPAVVQNMNIAERIQGLGLNFKPIDLMSNVVYWLVMIVTFMSVADILQIPALSNLLNAGLGYIPQLIVGVLIAAITFLAADKVKDMITGTLHGNLASHENLIGSVVKGIILFFGLTIAANQLGLDISLITDNFSNIVMGLIGAGAIAFGLGAKRVAGSIAAGMVIKNSLNEGSKVMVNENVGTIKKIGSAMSVVEIDGSEVHVPNTKLMG